MRDEIARLKGLKRRPKFRPSGVATATEPKSARAGREKRRRVGKIAKLVIDEERVIEAKVPADWRFKGCETYVVQDLILRPHVVRDDVVLAHVPARELLVVRPQPLADLRSRRPGQQQAAALVLEGVPEVAHR